MSQLVYGRDIPQIVLLHIGGFETVMFPKFLDLLKERGYKVVSLADAAADPAYAVDPDLPSNWDGTFLQQAARAKHVPMPPPGKTASPRLMRFADETINVLWPIGIRRR